MDVTPIPGPARAGRLRLTRRGRLVVIVLCALLVSAVVAWLAPASRAADPPGEAPTAVVQPGDTLWSVAERHRPSRDPFAMIREIRRLNGLGDSTVHPGQELTLPRTR
nr:LysM peptidoglycan-binding domain-containing protein [Micromonospora sp. DSM 115978]